MSFDFRETPTYKVRAAAAALGCGICGGSIVDPVEGGDPFSAGPYLGRYWCSSCWTIYYSEHPEHLADDATRRLIGMEAAAIRKGRGWELVYEEGENKVYFTERGTLLLKLAPREGYGAGEYHPEDFQLLARIFAEIDRKGFAGFTFSSVPANSLL
jgi:hypothetical protein